MALALLVRLRDGRYDAGGSRPDWPEWPPHPARLFCALAASASDDADWTALRWLENASPPEVWACAKTATTIRSGFVVTNVTHNKLTGFSQQWPGRTNGSRTRVGVVPGDPEFAVAWPGAEPDAGTVAALSRMARRVPYLGRSTSPAVLSVSAQLPAPRPEWTRWVPVHLGERGAAELRVPYPGYVGQLRDAYADGRRAWEVARAVPYGVPRAPHGRNAAVGPYAGLAVFGLERGAARVEGRSLLSLTVTLRQALISRIGTDVPGQVTGHGADDRAHVAYLALVDAGHEHADGHVLGVAIGLPHGMADHELSRLLAASVDQPLRRLTIRRNHHLGVTYEPFRGSPWGLVPERWTAQETGGVRRWVTATPMMLDRHPRRSGTVISEVARSLVGAGYPEPAEVEVSPAAMIPGAVHRPDLAVIPARRPPRPVMHARVTFPQPVIGPVMSGALRYLGLGLFAPERDAP
jgi:CRISPR-associated protein Csb2